MRVVKAGSKSRNGFGKKTVTFWRFVFGFLAGHVYFFVFLFAGRRRFFYKGFCNRTGKRTYICIFLAAADIFLSFFAKPLIHIAIITVLAPENSLK